MSTLLFTLLIAIIQYGLYFNDSISARQGVREAARGGVVRTFPTTYRTLRATDMDKLRCNAKKQVGALMGTTYIKVYYPTAPSTTTHARVGQRETLSRCARRSASTDPVNLVPMPNHGWIRTQTTMAVEQDDPPPLPTGATFDRPVAHAANWNWCTAP